MIRRTRSTRPTIKKSPPYTPARLLNHRTTRSAGTAAMAAATGGGGGSREEGLTLLGFWTSPFALRARFALNLKGVPYEYVEEDLFGERGKSPLLLASNPADGGKVPVLIHGGRPVAESLVILEYIDEAFPERLPRLLPPPDDPRGRAAARFWAACVDQKLLPTWTPLYAGSTAEERAGAAREVVAVLEAFEGELGDRDFFGGDGVGLVDVALGGFLGWLRASEAMCGVRTVDPARTPRLAAWAERFGALDGVREVVPDAAPLVEYNLMKRARLGLPYLPPHQTQQ
ncbi:probable glutathione S-transferase GSTU6 [Triticum dicoccoides]|uniref:probable glutathione S-transferase GSTU6 n=1 Tax=Triticum dicoccoides TaxID=85692 RepID=UPI0018908519|nr:probable glutathione S-transferase GSTU6 [Triticum dicoccoides]